MKIAYVKQRFVAKSQKLIALINEIIDEYTGKGFRLSLRQLWYQFVARGHLPNEKPAYRRLENVLKNGRLAGLIDWDAIEDRGRNVQTSTSWSRPNEIIGASEGAYQIDLWAKQEHRVEVWIEKETLLGVICGVCERLRLPYFACEGFNSTSEMWDSGHNRIRGYLDQGQIPIILHLGDHDPSGLDMTRDIRERLTLFAGQPVEVKRIALNMDQIKKYDPPPNTAKEKDSRYAAYVEKCGKKCWEIDALSPEVLVALIEKHADRYRDPKLWAIGLRREKAHRRELCRISDRYDDIQDYLNTKH